MGYDPSTYEKAPTEDENTNNTQNNDESSTISPKVVFVIIGLLVGVAIGYGIAQVLTDDSEPVTIEVPVENSNNDELTKLQNELEQANSQILILEGRLTRVDEIQSLLDETQDNLDIANRELLESTNKFNNYEQTIEDLQNEIELHIDDLEIANKRISDLLTIEEPAAADPEPEPAAADPEPDPEPEPAASLDEKISLGGINLVYGTSLIPISEPTPVGDSILIETEATNISENRITISWIAIITNVESGDTKEVYVFNIQLDPGKSFRLGNTWTPDSAGQYKIEAFAVDNLTDKNPISSTQSKVITVE
tara:strand:- start:10683 stop:11609 length:927 start_codon:yes stop_codon:yes gene_type:complete